MRYNVSIFIGNSNLYKLYLNILHFGNNTVLKMDSEKRKKRENKIKIIKNISNILYFNINQINIIFTWKLYYFILG